MKNKLNELLAEVAASANEFPATQIVNLLHETNAALADLVATAEQLLEKEGSEDMKALTGALEKLASRKPDPVNVQPKVEVQLPSAPGWSFSFKVKTNEDGVITDISGTAHKLRT